MTNLFNNLSVGTIEEVPNLLQKPYEWRLVNVSKTLHYALHAWKEGESISNQFCYVYHEEPLIVSLNWVDGPAKYFDYKNMGVINVNRILRFIAENIDDNKILITCDQGQSRAPSMALVYLAKLNFINNTSYENAAIEFYNRYYRSYNPGPGIQEFLANNWKEFSL